MRKNRDKIIAGKTQDRSFNSETTPLMLQYQKIKAKHKNEVLLFRLGDFYEMFDDDAVEVSRLLNLTLTRRLNQPMCGIPYHAVKIYIARLLRFGKKIAICEQIGEVTGTKLTERKVVEVITPGTAVESEYLDGGANNFLASLFIKKDFAGFAYIDVTTADFFATSWKVGETTENFSKEIGRVNPKEILLPDSVRNNSSVQDVLERNKNISVSYYPDWNFDSSISYQRLIEQFKTANLRPFSLSEDSPEVNPAGFLLDYLKKTTSSNSPHIKEIKIYKDCDFVIIDDSSRKNLEITSNLRDASTQFSLLECVSHTQTAQGNRLLRSWLNYPLTDSEKIKSRQNHIQLFFDDRTLLDKVRENFSSILDIERLAGRIAMEKAHAKDLLALCSSLEKWLSARKYLEKYDFAQTSEDEARQIVKLIFDSILENPSTLLTEGRIIKSGYSDELDHWKNVRDNFTKILEDYVSEEKEKTGIQNLKIRNNNISGFYIEVSKSKISQIPKHFIFKRSLINSERYTTERLQELERELTESAEKIIEIERDLFLEIRKSVADHVSYLFQTAREVAYVDVSCALAYSAILHNWVRPVVDDENDFIIKNGRHPVVELHLPEGEFVPNDTKISGGIKNSDSDEKTFNLITGPNMAGKSTYLRQNALIALLAQTGSFVPADKAKIGIVDRVFCRVGAGDNLAKGESTFLVEMIETANILRSATEKSLVIMDEVGRGTSTEDGLAIAQAVSEYLLDFVHCKTFFATHYHELTRLEHPALKLICMAVAEEDGKVVFLRKIKEGASKNSYGIHVARLAGIPETVINRATEILENLQKKLITITDSDFADKKIEPASEKNKDFASPGLFSNEELVLEEIMSAETKKLTQTQALKLIRRWKKALSNL